MLRRASATMNADKLTPDALQARPPTSLGDSRTIRGHSRADSSRFRTQNRANASTADSSSLILTTKPS